MNKVKENKKKSPKSDKSKVSKASTPAKEKKLNKWFHLILYKEFAKPQIKKFGHDLRKIFIIFPKNSTKDEK